MRNCRILNLNGEPVDASIIKFMTDAIIAVQMEREGLKEMLDLVWRLSVSICQIMQNSQCIRRLAVCDYVQR